MHSELIARLEQATGPDWRLDVSLAEHYYPGDRDMHRAAMEGRWKPTASIDAALTLVPTDWHLSLNGVNDSWHATINDTRFGKAGLERGFAPTPALAIVIAALRASGQGEG